jgi:hypothetical protein
VKKYKEPKRPPHKQLRKAAKRLRKAADATYEHMGDKSATQQWSSVCLPPNAAQGRKRYGYWVDAQTKKTTRKGSKAGSFYTVADINWGLEDAVYIALMQPSVGRILADLLDCTAAWCEDGWGKHYSPDSKLGYQVALAKAINKGWKRRAKREAK